MKATKKPTARKKIRKDAQSKTSCIFPIERETRAQRIAMLAEVERMVLEGEADELLIIVVKKDGTSLLKSTMYYRDRLWYLLRYARSILGDAL